MNAEAHVDGLLIVDKPGGMTSHDVVARVRRLAGTRRVGHAGTLDPMATGVLVLGLGRATRLLGHLSLGDKAYDGTVVFGATTSTDDAEGVVLDEVDATGVSDDAIRAALTGQVGALEQVPPAVSAIKVDGVRSYTRARRGEAVVMQPRRVTVHDLVVTAIRRAPAVEADVSVTCSSGTYIRSIARDAGEVVGVGGHLGALRRTRVGPYGLDVAHSLDALQALSEAGAFVDAMLSLPVAAAAAFPRRDVGDDEARKVRHGVALPLTGTPGPVAVFDGAGELLALVEDRDDLARPLCVLVG